jgi:hypothetical protein
MPIWIVVTFLFWLCAADGLIRAESGLQARIGPSGGYLEWEHQSNGQTVKEYLPLYQSGTVRYFSAGVGLLERQAEYPHFSLKLVFTAGGKPYLTGVDVAIRARDVETAVTIPKEQVEGPWLFVDLPTGMYDITATYGTQQRSLKGVKIIAGTQKIVYLRWAEDVGASVNLPTD